MKVWNVIHPFIFPESSIIPIDNVICKGNKIRFQKKSNATADVMYSLKYFRIEDYIAFVHHISPSPSTSKCS